MLIKKNIYPTRFQVAHVTPLHFHSPSSSLCVGFKATPPVGESERYNRHQTAEGEERVRRRLTRATAADEREQRQRRDAPAVCLSFVSVRSRQPLWSHLGGCSPIRTTTFTAELSKKKRPLSDSPRPADLSARSACHR